MISTALPYVHVPVLPVELPLLGQQTLTVFGPLVVVGVLVGTRLCRYYATVRGLDRAVVEPLTFAVVVFGFAMAHWVSMIFYYPDRVLAHPWVLFAFTSGLSSVGGFVGGGIAFAWVCRRRRLDARAWADVLAFGLLAGFTIGRIGCSAVHDHPGALAEPTAWLGVGPWPDGAYRYDLGLVEALALVCICAVGYLGFDWRRAPAGRLTSVLAIAYGSGRFALDFLRAEDLRYGGLTVAQLACVGFVVVGLALWRGRA